MSRWTTADIPNLSGRTVVITGANSGLGFEAAKALAGRDSHVVLAVRNLEKGRAAADKIIAEFPAAQLTLQELDLTALDSVRAAATTLRADHDRIDLLINNAGVMMTPKATTADGFELQFGTNHLGHFALTGLLLDRVLAAPRSRVVTVSSVGHRFVSGIRFDDLQWNRSYNRIGAYGQAKLANLMFTYELQRRLLGTTTIAVSAHPGFSNTELGRNLPAPLRVVVQATLPMIAHPPAQAALPSLRAATDTGVLGAQFYGPDGLGEQRGYPKLVTSSAASYDVDAQRRLWTVSEDLTGVTFAV